MLLLPVVAVAVGTELAVVGLAAIALMLLAKIPVEALPLKQVYPLLKELIP
jgi:hypothetical protein